MSNLVVLVFYFVALTFGQKGPKGPGPRTTLEPTTPQPTTPQPTTLEPTTNPIQASNSTFTSVVTTNFPTSVPSQAPTTSDTCLSSPNELNWTLQGTDFVGSLNYGVSTFEFDIAGVLTIFTVRTYENQIPLPTIRMQRGRRYLLTVNNNLGPESPNNPAAENNVFKDPNTTNIHTHGLHISGDQLADNVFTKILPGESHTFDYRIPCEHSAGTHWYHPHHHGSTTLQVGSGAAGLLFIEEDPDNSEGLPQWLLDINNNDPLDLIIQHINLQLISSLFTLDVDRVTSYLGEDEFTLLNSEFRPTICLNSGEWRRINMLYVNIADDMTLTFNPQDSNLDSECELLLLSRDGVLLHGENNETPRSITELLFSVASRADILITCDPGIYDIIADGVVVGYISSTGTSLAINAPTLTVFNPIRPYYLTNLLNEINPNEQNIILGFNPITNTGTINGVAFPGDENQSLLSFNYDTLQEWTIIGSAAHPYHQHIYHFQLTQNGAGNDLRGDWFDVLHTNNIIRFRTNTFGGKMMLHCHILEHEDLGLMALINIDGGCNYNYTGDTCNYDWPCINA